MSRRIETQMLLDEGARRHGAPAIAARRGRARVLGAWMLWVPFTAVYCAICFAWMRNKALWFDELITWHTSQVPFERLGEALRAGADANPPLFHLITRASIALFGNGEVGLRVPAAFGYWLMMFAIWLAVRRRCSAVAAWAAATLPLAWQMRSYAVEARAYGLMLGFSALAVLCWMRASEEQPEGGAGLPRRWPWIAGMGASLAAAVSSHYFAVFAALPVAAGELWRWWRNGRKPDWAVAATGALSLLVPLAAFAPLAAGARQYGADAWSRPTPSMIPFTYVSLLGQAAGVLGLMAAVAAVCVAAVWSPNRGGADSAGGLVEEWPGHWSAAVLALVVLPAIAVPFAMLVTKAYVVRYAGITVIGFALAAGLGVEWMRRRFGHAVALAWMLSIAVPGAYHFYKETTRREAMATIVWMPLAARYPDLPVVVDTMLYYEALHYTPPVLHGRIRVVADAAEARRQSGSSAAETGLRNMARLRPLPGLVSYAELIGGQPRTFLYVSDTTRNPWLVSSLIADGAQVRVLAMGPVMVHLVSLP